MARWYDPLVSYVLGQVMRFVPTEAFGQRFADWARVEAEFFDRFADIVPLRIAKIFSNFWRDRGFR